MKNHILFIYFLIMVFLHMNQSLLAEIPEVLRQNDTCVSCHVSMEYMPEDFKDYDIHLQEGLSCAGCHGGDPHLEDPEASMDPAIGFIGVPDKKHIPEFCGKCHSNITFMRQYRPRIATDQVEEYYTSVHGKKLMAGDDKVADCISCHTAHGIPAADDARSSVYPLNVPATCQNCHGDKSYMKPYAIPTNQYPKYARSVHGMQLLQEKDIGAPACNDCHGNHGATPPGVESISHVCGNCHVNNMEYFEASPMAAPYEQLEIHACEQCHGYHEVLETNDDMVGTGDESVCVNCHSSGDGGYAAAKKIHMSLENFVGHYRKAESKLKEVQQKGMDDVDILFLLQEAHQTLIHTRTLVHTFDPEQIQEKSTEGIQKSDAAFSLAIQEIQDYYTRRRGFGVATLFITVLVIALFFKIRQMDKRT